MQVTRHVPYQTAWRHITEDSSNLMKYGCFVGSEVLMAIFWDSETSDFLRTTRRYTQYDRNVAISGRLDDFGFSRRRSVRSAGSPKRRVLSELHGIRSDRYLATSRR
jgi:hypothetical protein